MVKSSGGEGAAGPTARIAVLGRGLIPPGDPVLRGDDLGVLHGDGIFETMHLRHGRPWLRDEHLARLVAAALAIDLPLPPTAALTDLLDEVRADWPTPVEGALRLVCTRGRRPAALRRSTPRWPRCRRLPGQPGGTGSMWPPCRWG